MDPNSVLFCPRDIPHNMALDRFQRIRVPQCNFFPTKIWSRDSKKKKKPCHWCVLYELINPEMNYTGGSQGRDLYTQLNNCKPICAEIVQYEFYDNQTTGERGWLFIWRNTLCDHLPNFRKN